MRSRTLLALLAVALAGCGSDDGTPPTLSTPPPPVTTPLNGAYDLAVTPAPACALPDTPYILAVEIVSFAGGAGTELRGTLPEGGDSLALDMLYVEPGRLQGSLSTRFPVPLGGDSLLFLRASGTGLVSANADGRAEVRDGVMSGDVVFYEGAASGRSCTSLNHSWALFAR